MGVNLTANIFDDSTEVNNGSKIHHASQNPNEGGVQNIAPTVLNSHTDTAACTMPTCNSFIEPEIEVSHYPIQKHTPSQIQQESIIHIQQDDPSSPSPQSSTTPDTPCRCSCHHTHHHHHHHTIFINGNSTTKNGEIESCTSTKPPNPTDSLRKGVLKTKSCPAWADGAPKCDRPIKTYSNIVGTQNQFTSIGYPRNTYFSHNSNGNNTTDNNIRNDDYQIRDQHDYKYSSAKTKGNTCCCALNKEMIALLVVLFVVILSLLSGLIYFLVRGNVTVKPETNVPKVSTVLNQTSICGKFPEEYLSISTRTINRDRRPSNLHPPENDNRINISQAARIIGGVSANIVQYPWQENQTASVRSKSMTADDLIDKSRVQGRIYGGTPSTALRFPWQVHLYAVSLWVELRGMTCGGSIILRDWVITAAHCTETNDDPELWTAYMGMSQISSKMDHPAQQSDIIKIIQHEHYVNNWSYDYDISLLKLKTPVTFTPSVQPICIPHSTDQFNEESQCYISGWGATSNSGQVNNPKTLQHAQVNIIGYATCRKDDWLGELVSDRMMCAGTSDGSRDACQGDSGGPLSCYDAARKAWTLAGSVSWGIDCGQPKQPGVYTKMTFFVDWIWTKIGKAEGLIPDDDPTDSTISTEGSASGGLTE